MENTELLKEQKRARLVKWAASAALAGAALSLLAIWQSSIFATGENLTSYFSSWVFYYVVWPVRTVGAWFGKTIPIDWHLRSWKSLCLLVLTNSFLSALIGALATQACCARVVARPKSTKTPGSPRR